MSRVDGDGERADAGAGRELEPMPEERPERVGCELELLRPLWLQAPQAREAARRCALHTAPRARGRRRRRARLGLGLRAGLGPRRGLPLRIAFP